MPLRFRGAGLSDRGRVRRRDEDAYLVDEDNALFAVADGVGGHHAGEIASQIAVRTLALVVTDAKREASDLSLESTLKAAFSKANEEIGLYSASRPAARGLATTLVAFLGNSASGIVAHVGDSRAYLLRRGILSALTSDHSALNHLARQDPGLDVANFKRSPLAHVLTRCLGDHEDPNPDLATIDLEMGDRLLLCCDGLTDMVSEAEVERILASEPIREACCRALVDAANSAGGEDNITVLVVDAEIAGRYR